MSTLYGDHTILCWVWIIILIFPNRESTPWNFKNYSNDFFLQLFGNGTY